VLNIKELRTDDFGQKSAKPGVSSQVRILKDLMHGKILSRKKKRQLDAGAIRKTHSLA